MPVYTFESVEDASKTLDKSFSFDNAPSIGSVIEDRGESWRRMPSFQLHSGIHGIVRQYPYESSSLPRNIPGCKKSKKGKPIVQSRAHERNIIARHGFVRD